MTCKHDSVDDDGFRYFERPVDFKVCPYCTIERQAVEIEALRRDAERLDWYESQHTLHYWLELLYVVDGYELSRSRDGNIQWAVQADNLRAAIDAALSREKDDA